MSASSGYLAKHNRVLMVMAFAWAKEQNLINQNVKWYQEKRESATYFRELSSKASMGL